MDFSLFYSDALHLVAKGNLKLCKSKLKATDSFSNAKPYKSAVCFNLNECDFPPLSSPATKSKPLHFPVKCVGRKPICRFTKSFAQTYESFRSTVLPACSVPVSMSHSSLHQPLVTSAPSVSPVIITTATATRTTTAPTSATRSPYSPYPACVSSPPVTTLSILSQKNSDRAASVPPSFLPSSIVVSSVNSLNSSYVARTKPLSFKATKYLVPKSLPPLKTSICINSSASGQVSDGAVSDSTNTSEPCVALVQHAISNSKQVVDLDSFNSGDIYLSSLSKFPSFVTTQCSPTLLSLLVSFLALCSSSKLLLIFYLVILTFLTRCFLLTPSNCVIFSTYILPFYMLPYVFILILFFIRRYTNFQKRLIFGFLLRRILEILQFFQYTKIYEAMQNVGIALFYRFCVVAVIITMRLLILEILCGDERLLSIFDFSCKAIAPVYYLVYLSLLLSKKILLCSLRFIKFLILCTRRFIILSLRFLFYLAVLYLSSVFLTSNMSCIGNALDANASCTPSDDFNDIRSFLIFSNNSVVNFDVHVNVN